MVKEVKEDVKVDDVPSVQTIQPKRKYKKITPGEFVNLTRKVNTLKELVELSGMSYGGCKNKLRTMQAGKVSLKKCLFEDGRKTRFKK